MVRKVATIKQLNKGLESLKDSGIYFEIRKCEQKIKDGNNNRVGRFNMDKDKHDILIANNGYYIFVVADNSKYVFAEIIPANDIRFRKLIPWIEILIDY